MGGGAPRTAASFYSAKLCSTSINENGKIDFRDNNSFLQDVLHTLTRIQIIIANK